MFYNKKYFFSFRGIALLLFLLLKISFVYGDNSFDMIVRKGDELFFKGRITQAIKSYSQAVQTDTHTVQAYLNSAVAYRTLGQNVPASTMLEKALEIDPSNSDIKCELGWLYYHENNLVKAENEFFQALQIKKDNSNALLGMGATLLKLGKTKESIKALKKLVEIRPTYAIADFFLADAYDHADKYEESLNEYMATLKKDWAFAESRIRLENISEKIKKHEQAWGQYSNEVSTDSENGEEQESVNEISDTIAQDVIKLSSPTQLNFTSVDTISVDTKREKVRIGLWTSATGKPSSLGSFTFEVSGTFNVIGAKSKKVYGTGQKGEKWKAIYSKGGLSDIISPDNKKLGPFKYRVYIQPHDFNATILIHNVTNLHNATKDYLRGREYRGALIIMPKREGIYLVNELCLEEYLLGVVPAEMPSHWPMEALKAQAVIARNQAILRKNDIRPHRKYSYDLCDGQHCQVYKGVRQETKNTFESVKQTQGKFLYSGKHLVESYYHANCGGHTQFSHEVKGWGRYNYLSGRFDGNSETVSPNDSPWKLNLWIKGNPNVYCNLPELIPTSEFRWLRIIPIQALEKRLNKKFRIGKLKAIIPLQRSSSGYVNEFLIQGNRRKVVIKKEQQIRHYLGLDSLRSCLFLIETNKNSSGQPTNFWVYGGGWGHGIGLCQSGAGGLALRDKKGYEEILKFYYPGTEIR